MKNYVKFVSKQKSGPKAPLSDLEIDEAWYFPETYYPNLYHRIRLQEKKTDKKFEYLKIKNGTVIRRWK